MKVMVALRQVRDPLLPPRPGADGSGLEADQVRDVVNPVDLVALEAVLRLKEAGHSLDILAVSVGPSLWEETLRTALALGADRAFLIATLPDLEPRLIARLLAALARREGCTMVLAGCQSSDGDHGAVGALTAGFLGWELASWVVALDLAGGQVVVGRELEGGRETARWSLPVVITCDDLLNTPRMVKLSGIVRARGKPVARVLPGDLGETLPARTRVVGYETPPMRRGGARVRDGADLLARLAAEGVLP